MCTPVLAVAGSGLACCGVDSAIPGSVPIRSKSVVQQSQGDKISLFKGSKLGYMYESYVYHIDPKIRN